MYKKLDTLSKIFYLGTIIPLFLSLITPILLNSRFLFPFITTKTIFFRIIIEIAVFFYLLLILRRADLRPKLTKVILAVLAFTGVVTIASLLGFNFYRSFWGNIERGEGLLTLYHVILFFYLMTQVLRSKKAWFWFINTYIAVSLVTAFYALGQMLAWETLFGVKIIHTTGSRLASTIGNASFYAGFLLFGIFLSLWQILNIKKLPINLNSQKIFKILFIIVFLFESFILFQTETRGSFIGLLGGLFLSAIIYGIWNKSDSQKPKQLAFGFILLVIILSGLAWQFREKPVIQNVAILRRITQISFDDVTTQSRLLTWDSSWQGLKDRPLLGYGWENYNIAFNKYFHAEIFRDAGSQIWFDRAHNIIFDIAVSSGIIGLIAYLSIFVFAIRTLYRHFKRNDDLVTFSILTGLLAAYFVQNLFVFDVLATYISFYLLLGYIAFLSFSSFEHQDESEQASRYTKLADFTPAFAVVLLAILAGAIYIYNVKPAQANLTAVQALLADRFNDQPAALELFAESIAFETNQSPEIRQKYAEHVLSLRSKIKDESIIRAQFENAVAEIQNNIKEDPWNVQHYLFLMMLYTQSDQYDPRRLDLAIELSEEALALSPTRPQIYFTLGQAYVSKGQIDLALETFRKAVVLQPKAIESHWNLAAALIIAGKVQEAEVEFEIMEELGYKRDTIANLQRISTVYSNAGHWDKLIEVYKKLLILQPNNAEIHARLAPAYKNLGDLDEARINALRAKELNPAYASVVGEFLQELGDSPDIGSVEPEVLRGE